MRGMFKTYDELESRHDLACLRYAQQQQQQQQQHNLFGVCVKYGSVCVCACTECKVPPQA